MRCLRFALAFAAVATAYFYHLDRPLLWGDEAHTGIVARGILRSGLPSAFDGRNVVIFDQRADLNRHLLNKQIPWVQWYVGAASIALFGNDTAGLRSLFALAGLLAFIPLWAALDGRIKHPEIIAALALIAPQTVLFQRNARYYPILILLYACLVWHLSRDFKSRRFRFATAVLIFVLLFHTHPFAALCAAASLALFCLFFRRRDLPCYLAAAGIGFLSWIAWYELLGPALADSRLFEGAIPFSDFGPWCGAFFRGVLAMFVDLDVVGSLPLLFLGAIVFALLVRDRRGLAGLGREPLFGFILIGVLVQAAATALVFGTEGGPGFAILRYLPHLAAFSTVACLVALDKAVSGSKTFLALAVFSVACNFATFSYWARPFGRHVPVSWASRVYADIFHPAHEAWDDVFATLRRAAAAPSAGDRAIIAVPAWTQGIMIFYLGDIYIVPPDFVHQSLAGPPANEAEAQFRRFLGDAACRRLAARPQWLVDSLDLFQKAPGGLISTAAFPSFRERPDDGARPELTRHTFFQPAPVAEIELYRFKDE